MPSGCPEIPGNTPRIMGREEGCSFAPRCAFAEPQCILGGLDPIELEAGHMTRCRRAAAVRSAGPEAKVAAHA